MSHLRSSRPLEPVYPPVDLARSSAGEQEAAASLLTLLDVREPLEGEVDRRRREELLLELLQIFREWIQEVCVSRGVYPDMESAREAGGSILVSGSYRLGVCTRDSDIDAICLAPRHTTSADFFDTFVAKLRKHPGVSELLPIPEASVPIIELVFRDVSFDLQLVSLPVNALPPALNFLDDTILAGLDARAVRSINGPRANELIHRSVPPMSPFVPLLRALRLWGRSRGLYSNKMGFLGGINFAILAAFTCQQCPNHTSPAALLHRFFQMMTRWQWPKAIMLTKVYELSPQDDVWDPAKNPRYRRDVMPIITPAYPCMNSSYSVLECTRSVMQAEFERGLEISKRAIDTPDTTGAIWGELFQPCDFFLRYNYYLVLDISADSEDDLRAWKGYVESRLRALLELIQNERAPLSSLCPYPTPTCRVEPLAAPAQPGTAPASIAGMTASATKAVAVASAAPPAGSAAIKTETSAGGELGATDQRALICESSTSFDARPALSIARTLHQVPSNSSLASTDSALLSSSLLHASLNASPPNYPAPSSNDSEPARVAGLPADAAPSAPQHDPAPSAHIADSTHAPALPQSEPKHDVSKHHHLLGSARTRNFAFGDDDTMVAGVDDSATSMNDPAPPVPADGDRCTPAPAIPDAPGALPADLHLAANGKDAAASIPDYTEPEAPPPAVPSRTVYTYYIGFNVSKEKARSNTLNLSSTLAYFKTELKTWRGHSPGMQIHQRVLTWDKLPEEAFPQGRAAALEQRQKLLAQQLARAANQTAQQDAHRKPRNDVWIRSTGSTPADVAAALATARAAGLLPPGGIPGLAPGLPVIVPGVAARAAGPSIPGLGPSGAAGTISSVVSASTPSPAVGPAASAAMSGLTPGLTTVSIEPGGPTDPSGAAAAGQKRPLPLVAPDAAEVARLIMSAGPAHCADMDVSVHVNKKARSPLSASGAITTSASTFPALEEDGSSSQPGQRWTKGAERVAPTGRGMPPPGLAHGRGGPAAAGRGRMRVTLRQQ